jgi:hypothetical protein
MIPRFIKQNNVIGPYYSKLRNIINLIFLAKELGKYDEIILNDRRAGFFSIYFQTLAALQVCKWNNQNLKLNYIHGPYFDPEKKSSTWWENYYGKSEYNFALDGRTPKNMLVIEDYEMMRRLAYAGTEMNRRRAYRLIQSLVPIKDIQSEIDDFYRRNFIDDYVIGIHYRGTDKVSGTSAELGRVPYEFVVHWMKKFDGKTSKFFIATDEEGFLKKCLSEFNTKIVATNSTRSKNDTSIHLNITTGSHCQLGKQALIDAILLSKCSFLLRCDSNLSLASLFFTPQLQSINLTEEYFK